jgi:hypothetical protein
MFFRSHNSALDPGKLMCEMFLRLSTAIAVEVVGHFVFVFTLALKII